MYGADFTTSAGDTVYSLDAEAGHAPTSTARLRIDAGDNRIFMTIWDGGGIDTYDLSAYAYQSSAIDLAPGQPLDLPPACRSPLLGDGRHARRATSTTRCSTKAMPRSLIENAIGGDGLDSIIGNAGGNGLRGGQGDDLSTASTVWTRFAAGRGGTISTAATVPTCSSVALDADRLVGNAGFDVFVYGNRHGSLPSRSDTIRAG